MPTIAVMLVLVAVKPLKGGSPINNLEIYNCVTLLCLTYCIMIFTPFGSEPGAKYTIGYFMVLIIAQNIVYNIYVVSKDPARITCFKCRTRWAKRGQLKERLRKQALNTKKFLSSKFSGSQDDVIGGHSDTLTNKTGRKLETIGELSIESFDSNEEIKVELDKLGVDVQGLKTHNRTV